MQDEARRMQAVRGASLCLSLSLLRRLSTTSSSPPHSSLTVDRPQESILGLGTTLCATAIDTTATSRLEPTERPLCHHRPADQTGRSARCTRAGLSRYAPLSCACAATRAGFVSRPCTARPTLERCGGSSDERARNCRPPLLDLSRAARARRATRATDLPRCSSKLCAASAYPLDAARAQQLLLVAPLAQGSALELARATVVAELPRAHAAGRARGRRGAFTRRAS